MKLRKPVRGLQPNPYPAQEAITMPICKEHDYEWHDESYDHEFGTEQCGYWECLHCGYTPEDLAPPEPEFFGDEAI